MISSSGNAQVTLVEKPCLKITSFLNYKHWYQIHVWSTDKACYDIFPSFFYFLIECVHVPLVITHVHSVGAVQLNHETSCTIRG